MSDQADHQEEQPVSKRGEDAWRADRDRIAQRNDQARKAGKQRRAAYELQRDEARRAADLRRTADLLGKHRSG